MLIGDAAILSFGVAWLTVGAGLPLTKALAVGFYPFMLSALVKEALGVAMIRGGWTTVQRF